MKKSKPINLVIVDDHDIYRIGVRIFLEKYKSLINIIGEFRDGSEFLDSKICSQTDIVLTDVFMPVIGGIELIKILKKNYPDLKIIMLSMSNCNTTIDESIELGASSYVLKCELPEKLLETILNIHSK